MKVSNEVVKIECSFAEVKSGQVAKEIVKLFEGHDEREVTDNIMSQYMMEKAEAEEGEDSDKVLIAMILGSNENDEDNMVKLVIG